MNRYEILIVDPDTKKVVHKVTHHVWALSAYQAAGVFAYAYGWAKHNNWVIKAVEVKT